MELLEAFYYLYSQLLSVLLFIIGSLKFLLLLFKSHWCCLFVLPIPMHFEFESEVFMMAVIAPLLFVEGTHISRTKLLEYRKPIVLMAMALVFATVIGVGFFIHWIWADLPMPVVAFAIRNSLPY